MEKILKILLFVTLYSSLLNAQSEKNELGTLLKDFNEKKKIAYHIRYVLKSNHSEDSPVLMIQNGKFLKESGKRITTLDGRTTLNTGKEVVTIDTKTKKIWFKKVKSQDFDDQDFLSQMQDYFAMVDRIKKTEPDRKSVTYSVLLKNASELPIGRYEITFNSRNNNIAKVVFFYNTSFETGDPETNKVTEKPRLEIYFEDRGKEVFTSSELQLEHYFTVTKNKLIPTSIFSGYDVKQIY